MHFEIGREYSRRDDIHAKFDGQRQGGISTPKSHPFIFIFTGKSGEQHGYEDGWHNDGIFLYTGEGQKGDMEFRAGNKAIRDHSADGKDILLFEALGRGKPVKFMGRFSCQSWDTFHGPDSEGNDRKCIQFHLVQMDNATENFSGPGPDFSKTKSTSLNELREKALKAANPSQSKSWRDARLSINQRSLAIREYVLARAAGHCELTGRPAPFRTKAGEPYLEVHHIRRLSDGGPDHPNYMAAICPTMHREIHFGQHGNKLNEKLLELIRNLED